MSKEPFNDLHLADVAPIRTVLLLLISQTASRDDVREPASALTRLLMRLHILADRQVLLAGQRARNSRQPDAAFHKQIFYYDYNFAIDSTNLCS